MLRRSAFISICCLLFTAVPANAETAEAVATALDHFRSGRFEEAHTAYSALLPGCTDCGPIHAGVIRSLLRQEKVKESATAADAALIALPKDAAVQTAIGELRFRQGDLEAADLAFVVAANAKPPDARAFLGLSNFYKAISKYKTAAQMIARAHQLDPDDPEIHLEWLYTQPRSKRLAELRGYLDKPNNLDPAEREGMEHHLKFVEARSKHPEQKCRLVSSVETARIDLRRMVDSPTEYHGFGIEVKINDRKTKLLLDTGASGITITRKTAEKAGVEYLSETKGYGIGDKDSFTTTLANAKSIRIGNMEFQNCVVDVVDRSTLDEEGLIGTDVFSNYLITLDFPMGKMQLAPLPKRPNEAKANTALASTGEVEEEEDDASDDDKPPVFHDRYEGPELKDYSTAVRVGTHFFIPTRIKNKSKMAGGLFLIDTGASTNFISPEFGAQITSVRKDEYTTVKGMSGNVKQVSRADEAEIQFSGLKQRLLDVISIDLSRQSHYFGVEVSGILGFTTLNLLTVDLDYRDGLVRFSFKPGRAFQ